MAKSDHSRMHHHTEQDFNLLFVSEQSPKPYASAEYGKKWNWAISGLGRNAFWYSLIIHNLHQTHEIPQSVTMAEVRDVITKGIKRSAFDRLKLLTRVSGDELARVVRIPPRTLARREVFHPDESERILRVAAVFQRIIEVFEDLDKARHWFSSPKRALGEKTPLQFCDTEVGAEEVMNLLGRIEHGVFS